MSLRQFVKETAINKSSLSFSALLILAAALFLINLGSYTHLLRAESNFALGSRMAVDTHEWLLPHAQHEAPLNRPPLQYWMIGVAYQIFGVGVFASRVPSALCGIALLTLVYWLGRQFFDPRVGLCAGAILANSFLYWSFSRLAMPDMLLALCISCALTCWLLVLTDRTTRPHLVSALGAAAMGLGFLCKGPVAVVLAGLPVLLDALCTRDLTPLKRLKPVTVLSVATLLTAPYFLLVWALHGGQPLENFFLTENMRRFAGTSWRHQEFIPPFYEIGVFLAGFAPWSPLVLAALWSHIRLKSYHPQAPTHVRLLLFWVLSPILFFSFSQFKLDYYFLPSMPPAALLVAQALSGNDGISAQSRRIKTAIWAVVLLIVVAIILLTLPVVEMNFSGLRLRWVPYAVAMLSFSASALWTKGQSVRRAVLAGAISIWLTTVASLLIFLPTYGQGRPVERIAASLAPGTTAYLVADAREWAWDLALYLATPEPIQFVSETEVIRLFESLSAHDGPASILMYRQEFEQLPHTGSEPGPVAAFPVRRGDNLTWKSLRHPLWDTLYVVTLERPG